MRFSQARTVFETSSLVWHGYSCTATAGWNGSQLHTSYFIYILLTKREGRTGRISARGLFCTDLAALGPYKKDQGPIFSQYGPEQAWLIRHLLHD